MLELYLITSLLLFSFGSHLSDSFPVHVTGKKYDFLLLSVPQTLQFYDIKCWLKHKEPLAATTSMGRLNLNLQKWKDNEITSHLGSKAENQSKYSQWNKENIDITDESSEENYLKF